MGTQKMLEIKYRKKVVTINHIWFFTNQNRNEIHLSTNFYFFHAVESIPTQYRIITCKEQESLLTDLKLPEQDIWGHISKTYRYEIKRCEQENPLMKVFSSKDVAKNSDLVKSFCNTYEEMFLSKGIKEKLNRNLFRSYIDNNVLYMTVAFNTNHPVVFHIYISDGKSVRLLYSCSGFRDESASGATDIGRLNKALHWFDIKPM